MGKFIGGFLGYIFLGGIFGIIIGAIAGHFFIDGASARRGGGRSRSRFSFGVFGMGATHTAYARVQEMYFRLLFSMLGKIAKADGTVTKAEGDFLMETLNRMNLQGESRMRAITYFNEAKNTTTSITEMAQQFAQLCANQPQLMRQMMYQLLGMASVDGHISSEEEKIIRHVAEVFGISEEELQHIFRSNDVATASSDAAYDVLGVSKDTDTAEIRIIYRKRLKEYHPDVLRSKGLPEELMQDAQKRFLRIQEAWTSIKKQRNIAS